MHFLTAENTIRDLCASQRHGYHPVLWPSVVPKRGVNGLKRYDAVRAAYSSLDSRSVSCRAIEMLRRAFIAQTFVTASLGTVFSPNSPLTCIEIAQLDLSVTSRQADRNRKRESGRWPKPFFTRKTGAKNSRKNLGSYLHWAESKSNFYKNSNFFMSPSL